MIFPDGWKRNNENCLNGLAFTNMQGVAWNRKVKIQWIQQPEMPIFYGSECCLFYMFLAIVIAT